MEHSHLTCNTAYGIIYISEKRRKENMYSIPFMAQNFTFYIKKETCKLLLKKMAIEKTIKIVIK